MAIILLPVKFYTQNLKLRWAVSYSTRNFGGACAKIYAVLSEKRLFGG